MATRAQKVRLGVFLAVAATLLAASVVTLTGLSMWRPRDRYTVRFRTSVSGLEVGASVKMQGVRVGQVEVIRVDLKDIENVEVTLALEPGTPIKKDTRAVVTSLGITGLMFIELTGGTKAAPLLKPGAQIVAGTSVIERLTGDATAIAEKAELVLNNLADLTKAENRERVVAVLDNVNALLGESRVAIQEGSPNAQRALRHLAEASAHLESASRQVDELLAGNRDKLVEAIEATTATMRGVRKAVEGVELDHTLREIDSAVRTLRVRVGDPKIAEAIAKVAETTSRTAVLAARLDKAVEVRDRDLATVMANLREASREMAEFSRLIRERPSLLLRGGGEPERSDR